MITYLLTTLVYIQNCGSIWVFHDSELNVFYQCKERGCTKWGFLNHCGIVGLFACIRVHGLPAGQSPANPFFHGQIDPFVKSMVCQE